MNGNGQGQLLDLTHFEQNIIGSAGGIHGGFEERNSIFNSSIMSQTYDKMNNVQVSQADIEKYQNNEQVKYCVKKYVCDEYKAGSMSEKFLKKAEELIYSYAKVVYSEMELEHMRLDMLRATKTMNP